MEQSIISASLIPRRDTGHSQVQFLASPSQIGSPAMAVMQGTLAASGVVPLHAHEGPESFYMLEGEMEVYLQEGSDEGCWTRARQGDLAIIRSNVKHAWRNTSSQPCVALIFTSADVCDFLLDFCELQPSVRDEPAAGIAKVMQLAADHQCWHASPEENVAIGLLIE